MSDAGEIVATGPLVLTVRVAVAVLLAPARAEVMEKLVVKVPRFGPFTARLKVQEAPPASGDPLTVRLLPSMDSVATCNWQVVGGTEEEAVGKTRPAGRAKEKVSKARGNAGLGLVKVIVRVEFVVCRIVEGLKARATANGLMTDPFGPPIHLNLRKMGRKRLSEEGVIFESRNTDGV